MVAFSDVLKHEEGLDSISTILSDTCRRADNIFSLIKKPEKRQIDNITIEKIIDNFENSWYHECAMLESIKSSNVFFAWKIIKMYYSIYCSLSAFVRCFGFSPPPKPQHYKPIKFFNTQILEHGVRIRYVWPLLRIHLRNDKIVPDFKAITSWDYGLKEHCPKIESALRDVKENRKIISLFDYFKYLREWYTYQYPKVMKTLYGESVKSRIDSSCENIVNILNTNFEYIAISMIGFEEIKKRLDYFVGSVETHLNFKPENIKIRFEIYSKNF